MVLDLHSNNFTGGLDYIFAKRNDRSIRQYLVLDLSDNMRIRTKISGKIEKPGDIKACNNGLTVTIPAELCNSTSLASIVLSNNNLTGGIPSGLMNVRLLRELDVSHNMLTGEIPPHNATIPASSFEGNSGLCGSPLPPCNTA
ncbi:receptor like protein 23-like [Papaver somniferum]|uniref:receptor like protein 23-like n=1 Tax=Papaver somniferum TaxID=3469 RepID=UPI000E6F7B66|nr:receptor like protein 23-like [Papaver somniferum]